MRIRNLIFKGIITLSLFVTTWQLNAQTKSELTQATKGFIENKGQVYDQNFKPNTSVKYLYSGSNGLNVQLKSSGFSYDTYAVERKKISKSDVTGVGSSLKEGDLSKESIYHFHRIDVDLVGANQHAQIVAEEPSSDFVNYYTPGTPEKGVLGLNKYQKVTYLEIYPGIDLEFIVHQEGDKSVEYNFIVKDNGDISQIKLKYTGADEYSINKDKINIKTSNGNMHEMIPASWIRETQVKQVVEYKIIEQKENEFTVGLFTNTPQKKGETLIIDPAPILEWATYFGGNSDEWIVKMSISPATNDVYGAGNTQSSSLATTGIGIHQINIAGYYDVILVKFNESGVRQWSTYYGGTGWDGAIGISLDIPLPGNDGVNIIGRTSSASGIAYLAHEPIYPAVAGEYATFIARFNYTNGALIWGTYYGHAYQVSLEDNPPAITNSLDAIYITSTSVADPKIVAGATPIQAVNGGNSDITIAKFALTGAIVWGTYYGGWNHDSGHGICWDFTNSVYLTGITQNPSLSIGGVQQPNYNPANYNLDAFLMKITTNGAIEWFTYYGDTLFDLGTSVSFSPAGNLIYMCGNTYSKNNIASPGSYIATKPGTNSSGFLACFNTSGVRKWGTYIGGTSLENANSVTTACNGEAIVILESYSPGLGTANAFQSTNNGIADALIMRFDTLGVRQWATYFGGAGRERGSDVKINNQSKIYVCGTTMSSSSIATPGSFQPSFAGGGYDGFIAKFSEINIAGTKTVCQNSTLSLVAEISTTATPITYAWSGPGGITGSNSILSVPNISLTSAGLYTLTVTQGSCIYIKTDSVKVNPVPTPTASVITPICLNDSVKLSSTGGVSYSWSGPNGFVSAVQNPNIPTSILASAGVYTVTVTNSLGCTATAQATLVVNSRPASTASSNSPICENGKIDLSSLPNSQSNYSWSGPLSFLSGSQSPSITNAPVNSSGIYTVTITNTYGCTASAQTTVVVNANPIASATSNSPICEFRTIKLSSSPAGLTSYLWSGPLSYTSAKQNDSIVNALVTSSGLYQVIVTNIAGCKDTAYTNVVVNPNPIATATSNSPICQTKTLKLSSTPSSLTSYLWSGPLSYTSAKQNDSIENAITTQSGIYTVIVTNSFGCKDTAQTTVLVNPNPIVTASSNSPVCQQDTIKLSSTGGISWAWSNGSTFTNTDQNPTIPHSIPSMSGTYTVIATNGFGCTASAQTPLVVNAKPIATISSSPAVCAGHLLNLYSGGGSQYSWEGPNGYSSIIQNPIIDPVAYADSGLYTVIVTNDFTCKDTISLNVIVYGNPTPTISSNSPLCAYDSIQLIAGGGVGYAWTGTNSYTSSAQNPIIQTIDNTLSGTYSVVVTNQYGCTASTSTVVDVKTNPKPILNSNSPICAGDSLKLYSSAGQSYLWNGPMGWSNTNQNPIQSNALVALNGYFKQTITYANGCVNDDSLVVVVHTNPVIILNSDTTICRYQGINVSATGATSYHWNNGINTPNYLIYPTADTTYQVFGVDGNGCRDTASFDVTVLPFIEVTILQNPSDTLFTNQITTFTVIPSGYSNYSFYLNNTIVQNSASNTYTSASLKDQDEISVEVSEPNMCFSSPKIPIHVIGIYNSFSPNGDGYNDLFLKGYQITIFSRWGDKLYEGVDGWDGKFNGEDLNTGTYFFTLKYNSNDGNVIEYKGDVTVIR